MFGTRKFYAICKVDASLLVILCASAGHLAARRSGKLFHTAAMLLAAMLLGEIGRTRPSFPPQVLASRSMRRLMRGDLAMFLADQAAMADCRTTNSLTEGMLARSNRSLTLIRSFLLLPVSTLAKSISASCASSRHCCVHSSIHSILKY